MVTSKKRKTSDGSLLPLPKFACGKEEADPYSDSGVYWPFAIFPMCEVVAPYLQHHGDEAQTATGASPLRNELGSVKEAASKPEGCKA